MAYKGTGPAGGGSGAEKQIHQQGGGRNAATSIDQTTDEAREPRWCRYCDAYRLKLGRAERRRLARMSPGQPVQQWLTAHRDNCPTSTRLNTPGWHAAGKVRSPFKAVSGRG